MFLAALHHHIWIQQNISEVIASISFQQNIVNEPRAAFEGDMPHAG
jgi:hypothetical protein